MKQKKGGSKWPMPKKLTPHQYRRRTAELRQLLDKIDARCEPTTSLERRMLSNVVGSFAGKAQTLLAKHYQLRRGELFKLAPVKCDEPTHTDDAETPR